jgi:hypothetical protein
MVLLAVLAAGASAADDGMPSKFGKGLKAGIDLSNMHGSAADSFKVRVGSQGGGFVNYSFTPDLAVQVELMFAMKGAKSPFASRDEAPKVNYLELPVLLKFTVPT